MIHVIQATCVVSGAGGDAAASCGRAFLPPSEKIFLEIWFSFFVAILLLTANCFVSVSNVGI